MPTPERLWKMSKLKEKKEEEFLLVCTRLALTRASLGSFAWEERIMGEESL